VINWFKDKYVTILADLRRAHVSATVWVNGLALTALEALPFLKENFPELQDYVSPDFYRQAMTVIVVANIILRFKTNSALRNK